VFDVILDFGLPLLKEAELKVFLYILRKTIGWRKEQDAISLTQICDGQKRSDGTPIDLGTGLARSTVSAALWVLVRAGLIRKDSRNGGQAASIYAINVAWDWRAGKAALEEARAALVTKQQGRRPGASRKAAGRSHQEAICNLDQEVVRSGDQRVVGNSEQHRSDIAPGSGSNAEPEIVHDSDSPETSDKYGDTAVTGPPQEPLRPAICKSRDAAAVLSTRLESSESGLHSASCETADARHPVADRSPTQGTSLSGARAAAHGIPEPGRGGAAPEGGLTSPAASTPTSVPPLDPESPESGRMVSLRPSTCRNQEEAHAVLAYCGIQGSKRQTLAQLPPATIRRSVSWWLRKGGQTMADLAAPGQGSPPARSAGTRGHVGVGLLIRALEQDYGDTGCDPGPEADLFALTPVATSEPVRTPRIDTRSPEDRDAECEARLSRQGYCRLETLIENDMPHLIQEVLAKYPWMAQSRLFSPYVPAEPPRPRGTSDMGSSESTAFPAAPDEPQGDPRPASPAVE
jgi:hypothetical protein